MTTALRSFAKINLGLSIGPPRDDGFHSLATVYQTLELSDTLTVEAVAADTTSITLTTTHPRVPTDQRNTAWRMAEKAVAAMGCAARVRIHIEKRLPVEGGLGAGSANAAATLLAIEHELGTRLSDSVRMRLAAEVGSDVPLFLVGGMTLGTGRGEQITPLPDSPSLPCVVALPETGVSTADAFRAWDRLLTTSAVSSKIDRLTGSIAALFPSDPVSGVFPFKDPAESPLLALVRTGIENDFERVVFSEYPFLDKIKHRLQGSSNGDFGSTGALYAALSGSGSAVFGLYRSDREAQQAVRRLETIDVASVCTRTLPREEYRAAMWDLESVREVPGKNPRFQKRDLGHPS